MYSLKSDLGRMLVRTLRAVAVLAANPEDQVRHLRRLGVYPSTDELALEFSDCVRHMDEFVETGWLVATERMGLVGLDERLREMSGPSSADLWTVEALATAEEWQRIREEARAFLLQ